MYSSLFFFLLLTLGALTWVVHAAAAAADTEDTPERIIASIEIRVTHKNAEGDDVPSGGPKKFATLYDGEDAGIGAFRFAEEYGIFQQRVILDVAQQLMAATTTTTTPQQEEGGAGAGYTPPPELTHCSSAAAGKAHKKPKVCSAGKLWKRAEEMRKADMYDAAGADYIRILLKKGIEADFSTQCEHALEMTFGNIRRQREREKRDAAAEAVLEKRRNEELEAMEEAKERKKEYEAHFEKFGVSVMATDFDAAVAAADAAVAKAEAEATVDADGTVQKTTATEHTHNRMIVTHTHQVMQEYVMQGPHGTCENFDTVTGLLRKIPRGEKTVTVLLIEARCHEMRGNHQSALSAAGYLVQKAANYEPWVNETPRMMAATLGANAAMQLGLSKNALSFYQTVLQFDPEQKRARTQYKGLKKVIKLMDKAEEQIQKGYNKKASGFVDDCLSAMRGLDVDSPLFRSKIQLKQCTILSAMGQYEEALSNCDSAVEVRSGNDAVPDASKKEAYLIRAEALLLDMDYDEAVHDFREAFNLVPEDQENREEKHQLNQKLKQTMQQQGRWNGGQQDFQFNKDRGYPDGRPPERDHNKILQLPIDLEERGKDIKCAWLKKQFKTLVRKFHPDKYKGNKKRAARKFKEVTDSKAHLSSEWGCKIR